VEFIEAPQLRLEVNISSPSLQHLSRVNHNYTEYHNTLLLQLVTGN